MSKKEIVMTLANGVQIAVTASMSPLVTGNEAYDATASQIALDNILAILRMVTPDAFKKLPEIQQRRDGV